MSEPPESYTALRTSVAAVVRPRDVVRATGPDVEAYLQGQLSQDVAALAEGETQESLLLSPQGRVDAYLRVGRVGSHDFVIDVEAGFGAAVLGRLRRFLLRTRVELEPLDWVCTALRGPDAASAVGPGAVLEAAVDWPGLVGVDLLGPKPSGDASAFAVAGVPVCPPDLWDAARIESGEPRQGREIDERTIAAEVGLVQRTVSFTKGCFTGQELVARLDARGSKVARRLCGVVIDADVADPDAFVGAEVRPEGGASSDDQADHGRAAGTLTSAAWSPGLEATVALGLLHRSVVPPAEVRLEKEGASPALGVIAEARPLPLVAA